MIDSSLAGKVLAKALATGADFAELYVEDVSGLSLGLEASKLEQATRGQDRGAGVRVFFGNLATYAYTDDLSEEALLNAAHAAASAGSGSGTSRVINLSKQDSPLEFAILKPLDSMSIREKADILHQVDDVVRGYDSKIVQASAGYLERQRKIWVFNSEGVEIDDDRTFVEFRVSAVAKKGDILQRGFRAFGGQIGLELFQNNDPIEAAELSAESAVRMLDARPAPAGEMTVVMCNGWGGVLFHEACGHQMEADFITDGSSAYAGKKGEMVASPLITAIDDGTIPGRRGSIRFDDEGTPSSKTVLIEEGVMREYMWDRKEARRANYDHLTGNGRRENFRYMPIPRMTNTYIDNGPHDPQEIIESTKKGVYIKQMSGGQADITRGDFVFNATEAYLIEDGKLTSPVRGATVVGNGPAVLREIDMVGNDVALDPGLGMCGKGQRARVSVGQPTIRIPKVTVGGTD